VGGDMSGPGALCAWTGAFHAADSERAVAKTMARYMQPLIRTDGERLIAEHVVTDLVGAQRVRNDIFVDPSRRAQSPEAVDEHLVDEDRREGLLLGDRAMPLSPEAEHREEDLDAELYGSTDVQKVIEDGTPWIPPESPTQEGLTGRNEFGEDH